MNVEVFDHDQMLQTKIVDQENCQFNKCNLPYLQLQMIPKTRFQMLRTSNASKPTSNLHVTHKNNEEIQKYMIGKSVKNKIVTIIPMRVHSAWASFMLCVVKITAVFPCRVESWEITSHMNRLATGSIPTILHQSRRLVISPKKSTKEEWQNQIEVEGLSNYLKKL